MGRKKKDVTTAATVTTVAEEKDMVKDRVGESVDLNKCPACSEHLDCFGNIKGKCTALKEAGGQGCVFYKNCDQAVAENKVAYKKLLEDGRYDIIQNYGKQLVALGSMDDEILEAEDAGVDFDAFAEADYQKQLEEAKKDKEAKEAEDAKEAQITQATDESTHDFEVVDDGDSN